MTTTPHNEALSKAFGSLITKLQSECTQAPELSFEISPTFVVGLIAKTRACEEFIEFSNELASDPIIGSNMGRFLKTENMTAPATLTALQILRSLASDLPRMLYGNVSAEQAYVAFESSFYDAIVNYEATVPVFYLEWQIGNEVLELCDDTRLVRSQIGDSEYYKIPRPFRLMDPYLRPQGLLRINWSESMTVNAGPREEGKGLTRFMQFLNIVRLSKLFTCEMPFIVIEPVAPGLGLRYMKAYHVPANTDQMDTLNENSSESLRSLWSRIAQKLEPRTLPEKFKIALNRLNSATLRTNPLDALVDLWISMEFLVPELSGKHFLSTEGLSDLFCLIKDSQIRKDSSGARLTQDEMLIVAERVRNKVNQLDLRQRFDSFCEEYNKYKFSPTGDEIHTVWRKDGLRDQRNNLEHGREVTIKDEELTVMGELLRRMAIAALEKETLERLTNSVR
jgi:hypothetical protein